MDENTVKITRLGLTGVLGIFLGVYFIYKVNWFFGKIGCLNDQEILATIVVIAILALLLAFILWIILRSIESMNY